MTYSEAQKAVIYGLRQKDTVGYFYVGSTKHALGQRLSEHLAYSRLGYNRNRHFVHKLNQIGPENVTVDVLETTDQGQRFEREYWWIQHLFSDGHSLTNIKLSEYPVIAPLVDARALRRAFLWYLSPKKAGRVSEQDGRLYRQTEGAVAVLLRQVMAYGDEFVKVLFQDAPDLLNL